MLSCPNIRKLKREQRTQKGLKVEDLVIEHLRTEFPNIEINRQKTRGVDIELILEDKIFRIEVKSAFDQIIYKYNYKNQIRYGFKQGHFKIKRSQLHNYSDIYAFVITYRNLHTGDWNGKYTIYFIRSIKICDFFSKKRTCPEYFSLYLNTLRDLQPKHELSSLI